jgi:hypothetical protein
LRLANPCARLIDFIPRQFRGGTHRAQCLNVKISKCRGIYVCARLRSPL